MRMMIPVVIACLSSSAFGQTWSDFPSYCRAMSEASMPTLLARTQNVSRAQAETLIQGTTDPNRSARSESFLILRILAR